MLSKTQRYLHEAAACERCAAAARTAEEQAVYREMARLWLRLASCVRWVEQRESRPLRSIERY
jgi:hypothetical protein